MPLSEADKVEVIPMLGKIPIFSSLDKKRLSSIAKVSTKRVFKEGRPSQSRGIRLLRSTSYCLALSKSGEERRYSQNWDAVNFSGRWPCLTSNLDRLISSQLKKRRVSY